MKKAIPLALVAVVATLLTGCGSESGPKREAASEVPAATAVAAPEETAAGDDLDAQTKAFVKEFTEVQDALEVYWKSKIDGYTSPVDTLVFGGKSDDPSTYPSCGEEQVEAENGFFCPPDNTIILDAEWMQSEYTRIGDSFLYVVLAHEYGHSAQDNLAEENKPAEADEEVQADCFSGAFWQESVEDGTFDEEDGDEQEINQTLVSVAGDFGTDDNHGTLAARSGAFEYGRKNGAEGCLDTTQYVR